MLWHYQAQSGDAFMGGCNADQRTDNCPKVNGPDQDIGNSPILCDLPGGKSVIVFGKKDGTVTALDPDHQGAVVWQVHAVDILPEGPGKRPSFRVTSMESSPNGAAQQTIKTCITACSPAAWSR